MVTFDDSQLIHLVDVQTGKKQILIQGSPNSQPRVPSAFFLKCGDGYELHFCTVKQQKGSTVQSWYRWYLGPDFFKTLKNYGGLPLEFDVDKLMTTINQKNDLETERDNLKTERDDLETERDNLKTERDDLETDRDNVTKQRDDLQEQLEINTA